MQFVKKGLIGSAVAGLLTAASRVGLRAQEDDGVEDEGGDDFFTSLGDVIAGTVQSAVAPIASVDEGVEEGTAEGDVITLDESQGLAIADASGGANNFAFVS